MCVRGVCGGVVGRGGGAYYYYYSYSYSYTYSYSYSYYYSYSYSYSYYYYYYIAYVFSRTDRQTSKESPNRWPKPGGLQVCVTKLSGETRNRATHQTPQIFPYDTMAYKEA